jgi:hypothetical protein
MSDANQKNTSLRLPKDADLRALLDHARSQFQYHAKQRLDSIRYYFIAYGIFTAAYFNSTVVKRPAYTFLVAVTAAFITVAFWALDFRNAQMVEIDERSVIELEGAATKEYGLTHYEAMKECEKPDQWRRYKYVMRVVFTYLLAVSLLAAIWSPHD